jgi:hypothetical protein
LGLNVIEGKKSNRNGWDSLFTLDKKKNEKNFAVLVHCRCGMRGKSHEEIAQELITKRIKDSLPPDFKYESAQLWNYGQGIPKLRRIRASTLVILSSLQQMKDSLEMLKQAVPAGNEQTARLTHNIEAINDSIQSGKGYHVPEQIFKMSHAYKITDASGVTKTKEDAYYIDAQFTRIIKVQKVY